MLVSRAVHSVSSCQFYFHLHLNTCHLNNQSSLLVIHLFLVFLNYKSKVELARITKFFTNLWQILSSHHSETIYGHIVIHALLINFHHLFLHMLLQNITCKFHCHIVVHQGSGNFQKGLFSYLLWPSLRCPSCSYYIFLCLCLFFGFIPFLINHNIGSARPINCISHLDLSEMQLQMQFNLLTHDR